MVAFSVARETTFSGSINPVQFDVTLYNEGFDYDDISHSFIAPSAGVYYFSYSLGLIAGGRARLTLYKNDEPLVNILRESTIHTGTDTIGRSVMMELDEDDTVHIGNPDGYTVRSSELKETSFCGFKYEPKHGNQVSCNINATPFVVKIRFKPTHHMTEWSEHTYYHNNINLILLM